LFSFSSLPAFPYGEYTAFAEDNNALALQKMKVCSMPKVAFKDDDLTVDAEQGASLRDLAQAEDASILWLRTGPLCLLGVYSFSKIVYTISIYKSYIVYI
jgi:hypothetical protein